MKYGNSVSNFMAWKRAGGVVSKNHHLPTESNDATPAGGKADGQGPGSRTAGDEDDEKPSKNRNMHDALW